MHDIFSFSKPDGVWYAWEWLSDVLFARPERAGRPGGGGAAGHPAAVGDLHPAVPPGAAEVQRRRGDCGHHGGGGGLFGSLAGAAAPVHAVVPGAVLHACWSGCRKGARVCWRAVLALLPLATILWTNLHGGFFVGIADDCGLRRGRVAARWRSAADRGDWRAGWRKAAQLFPARGLACLAASLVNPYTYHLHVHVCEYLRDPYHSQHIMEFLSLSFHHPVGDFLRSHAAAGALALRSGTCRKAASPSRCCCWCGRTRPCWRRAIFRFS